MNSNHFLLTVLLFITFIPGLFFTLPPCSKDKDDNVNNFIKYITHAVLFTIVLMIISI